MLTGLQKIAFHGLYIYYVIWYICILYKFKKTEARGPLSVFLSLSRVIFYHLTLLPVFGPGA